MPNGRPLWKRRTTLRRAPGLAALMLALAVGSGCQRLPMRHLQVDPVATSRATTTVEPAATGLDLTAESAVEPQPPSVSSADSKIVVPLTPLLDAALARVHGGEEGKTAATSGDAPPIELPMAAEASATKPVATIKPVGNAPDFELAIPAAPAAPEKPTGTIVKPLHDPAVTRASTDEAEIPKSLADPFLNPKAEAESASAPPLATKAIDPERPVPPGANQPANLDEWADGLSRLRSLARERAGEPGGKAEAWAIRARVLDWLAGDGDDPRGETGRVWNGVLAALSTATSTETVDETALAHHLGEAVETLEAYAPLQIRVLKICRKVQGFGQYEPLDAPTTRAGQPLLVYCEMVGLKYEQVGDDLRSRVASRVEVTPAAGGQTVWSQALGTAEDRCRHRRRDYYVNYRLALPATLPQGPYAMRLTQTDLLTGRSISSSAEFRIIP